jgi:hypothetical protein
MGTYVNIRDIINIEREDREYINNRTKIKGIVEILTIETKDGTTTINLFKEVKK